MKTRLLLVIAALMMLFAFGAMAEDFDYEYEYEYEYDCGNPPLAPDISLPANPSTGYLWTYETDDPCVEIMDMGVFTEDDAPLGAGGIQSFRLHGAEPGFAQITLRYARSWEEDAQYTFLYRVIVTEEYDVLIYEMEML